MHTCFGTSTIWILTSTWMRFSESGLILTRPGSTARANRPNLVTRPTLPCATGWEDVSYGKKTPGTVATHLVWVRADDATGNCSQCTNARTKRIDHTTVPSVLSSIFGVWLNRLRIARLKVFAARWLHLDNRRWSVRSAAVGSSKGRLAVDIAGTVHRGG